MFSRGSSGARPAGLKGDMAYITNAAKDGSTRFLRSFDLEKGTGRHRDTPGPDDGCGSFIKLVCSDVEGEVGDSKMRMAVTKQNAIAAR